MPYTPVPTDPTVPTDDFGVGYSASELRALKAYIQGLVLGAAGFKVPVRQTVLAAAVAAAVLGATPIPANIVAGTGLQVDFKATGLANTVLAYANGFDANGNVDYVTQLSADILNVCGNLGANNTSFLFLNRLTATTVAGGNTPKPPQYGYSYDRSMLSSMGFNGTAGSTAFTDDNGNAWTAQGGAKHQVNQIKFGAAALGGAGAANVLNGAGDFVRSADVMRFMQGDSWAIRGWVYPTALPGVGQNHYMAAGLNAAGNASGTSYLFGIYNAGGTIRFGYHLSGDNSGWTIASAIAGTTLPVINTWYYVELTFDGANYRLYVNGLQEAVTVSSVRTAFPGNNGFAALAGVGGVNQYINGYMDGWEHLPYCDHPAGTAYAAPVAGINIATSAPDFFDISEMKMKSVSAASVVSGTNPTFAQVNRLYVGEAVTSGVAVTGVTLYALKGEYQGAPIAPSGASTLTAVPHNIGCPQVNGTVEARMKRNFASWRTGQRVKVHASLFQYLPTDAVNVFNARDAYVNTDRKTGYIASMNFGLTISNGLGSTFLAITGAPNDAEVLVSCRRDWGRA